MTGQARSTGWEGTRPWRAPAAEPEPRRSNWAPGHARSAELPRPPNVMLNLVQHPLAPQLPKSARTGTMDPETSSG